MTDAVILVILVIALIFGAKGTVKHFKGQGACCGGGSGTAKVKHKSLGNPKLGEKMIQIEGMHCAHCRKTLLGELNKIEGVAAKVDLKKNRAVVFYDRPVEEETLCQAVEKAGFKVTSIE